MKTLPKVMLTESAMSSLKNVFLTIKRAEHSKQEVKEHPATNTPESKRLCWGLLIQNSRQFFIALPMQQIHLQFNQKRFQSHIRPHRPTSP